MTKEEKIAELINIRDNFNHTLAPREVFDDAIKALNQESILDKIRAELVQMLWAVNNDYAKGHNYGLRRAIQTIDKYKAESEDI